MHRLICGVLVLALVGVAGCPGGTALPVEPVEGVVTLDGEPVPAATVEFVPVTEGEGMSAYGMTDEQGVYRLTAVGTEEAEAPHGGGTLPGEYYVGVTKSVADVPMSAEEAAELGVEYQPPAYGQSPQMTYVVPRRYNRPRDSGIRVTVEPGQNTIDLELTSN